MMVVSDSPRSVSAETRVSTHLIEDECHDNLDGGELGQRLVPLELGCDEDVEDKLCRREVSSSEVSGRLTGSTHQSIESNRQRDEVDDEEVDGSESERP